MIRYKLPRIYIFEPFIWIYYIWYYLPIARGTFSSNLHNYFFFSFIIIGFVLLLAKYLRDSKKLIVKINVLSPILCYMVTMTIMSVIGIEDANLHIRVSFSFWLTIILFFAMEPYSKARKRLAILLLILFSVTTITSLIGVILDPHAARTLTYASNSMEEDIAIKKLNIGSLSFFQSLLLCVPIIISFINKKKRVLLNVCLLIIIFITLIYASFTTSIIIFFVALLFGILSNIKSKRKTMFIVIVAFVCCIMPWNEIIDFLQNNIQNDFVSTRLDSIIKLIEYGKIEGNLASRVQLYYGSLKTFLHNPFGIGPKYSYNILENGIGYHSQILDDLARYGIFALLFYICFFVEYEKLLKQQWGKVGMRQNAAPIIMIYIILLLLNPGFTSAYESVVVLFVIPMIPEIINERTK